MTSVLVKFYLWLCSVIPGFRKITRKWMYQVMARFIKQDQWSFMNYGYAQINDQELRPMLESSDEVNRLSFQLYHHLANEIDLEQKSLLEVGSGRGGGASMIKKYHRRASRHPLLRPRSPQDRRAAADRAGAHLRVGRHESQ